MTIKKISIEYDALNSKNVFTNGDIINGRITVKASQDSPISSLVLIASGAANVSFGGTNDDDESPVREQELYYGITHYILLESEDAPAVIGKGRNVFPFSFKFPDRNLPTSFKSTSGWIVHGLKAKLKQHKKLTIVASTVLNFVSKTDVNIPQLMNPQLSSQRKTFQFGSGHILMDVYIAHQGYKQGEDLWVTLGVANNSGRKMTSKFILCDQQMFTAQHKTNEASHKLLKKVSRKVVKPYRTETIIKVLNIPGNLTPSILNCSFIHLKYWLKVYLVIPFARNPRIMLPIVLLPSSDVPVMERSPASAAAALDTFGSSIQAHGSMQQATLLPEEPPPAYETL